MKYCDHCHSSYPGDFTTCPKDQKELRSITELMPGLVLRGKYEILERIGAGGMGAVYKAKHSAFGEIRAIKFIGSHLVGDSEFLARFRGEAVLARKLQHPNVVRVEDLDTTEDGRPFIVMEYVEGRSLRSVLRQEQALGPRRAVDIVRQTLQALAAAHALGILHRDIKPENLVLVAGSDGAEVVKVLDFGLAKVLEGFEGAGQQVSTQTGMMVGTPQYIAPEQALPDKAVELDGRVDLYSLGVLLYELVTGSLPFQADTPMGMVLHHIQTRPKPPHVAHPERKVPPALSVVVMKALEKDRERRYASATEMDAALVALAPVLPLESPVRPGAEALLPETVVRTPRPGASRAEGPGTIVPARTATGSGVAPTVSSGKPAGTARLGPPSPSALRTRPLVATPPREPDAGRSPWGLVFGALVMVAVVGLGVRWSRQAAPGPSAGATEAPADAEATPETPAEAGGGGEATPSDDAVYAEVQELLVTSPALQDARIEIAVANGIVTLSGEAPSATARALAASLARSAAGAKQVFNLVKLTPAGAAVPAAASTPLPADTPPPVAVEAARPAPPPPVERAREDEVRALMDQAKRQIDTGDHEGAARTFEAVLRIDPNHAHAKEALERFRSRRPPPPPPR